MQSSEFSGKGFVDGVILFRLLPEPPISVGEGSKTTWLGLARSVAFREHLCMGGYAPDVRSRRDSKSGDTWHAMCNGAGMRHSQIRYLRAGALILMTLQSALQAQQIHEVLYDGSGTDADDAFTEIVGPAGTNLDGWTLVGINGGTGAAYRTVSLTGAQIPVDGLLVVATDAAVGALLAARDFVALVDWQNGPDALQLVDPAGTVVDALQYGDAGAFNRGEGTPALQTSPGQSLSRDSMGTDTDDNLTDFSVQEAPTPGVGPTVVGSSVVSLPDTTAPHSSETELSVAVSDVTGLGIVAVELFVAYDADLFSMLEVSPGTMLGPDWTVLTHVASGESLVDTAKVVAASGSAALLGAGTLMEFRVQTARRHAPTSTAVVIEHLLFNDGTPTAAGLNGTVTLTGTDGSLTVSALPPHLPSAVQLTVQDLDEDRDPARPDSLLARFQTGSDIETVQLTESDLSTGQFIGSMPVRFAAATAGNDTIETQISSEVQGCYTDSLDSSGQTIERCHVLSLAAGRDGRVDVTRVSEPGDTLRVRVVDLDLNLDPTAVESIQVVVTNSATGDVERLTLAEIAEDDSVFSGLLLTAFASASSGDGLLSTANSDAVQVRYVDETSSAGTTAIREDSTQIVNLFGDADGNGLLQAFDATRVLAHVLVPFLVGRDSLAANVDSLAPASPITPYDASLILQRRVGVRHLFPVQAASSLNHPPISWAASSKTAAGTVGIALHRYSEFISLWVADRGEIVSGLVHLEGIHGRVEMADPLQEFLFTWRSARDGLRIALAGAVPAGGKGEILRIYDGDASEASLLSAVFNDGHIVGTTANKQYPTVPRAVALHPNHPNPFNPRTAIRFELPDRRDVRLEVFDAVGRQVRTLLAARLDAVRTNSDGTDGITEVRRWRTGCTCIG